MSAEVQRIGFGGGCHWCTEAVFAALRGVICVEQGFIRADAPDDNFSPKLIGSGGFAAGPVAAIEGSRKESDVGAPVGRVGTTVEIGAFAEQSFGAFRIHAQGRKGIGGHEGMVGHLAADYVLHDEAEDRYAFTIGPRLIFSDSRYQRAFFGVTPEVALATGLVFGVMPARRAARMDPVHRDDRM